MYKVLTEAHESAIREYNDYLDEIDICSGSKLVVKAANYFVRFKNCIICYQWLNQFL